MAADPVFKGAMRQAMVAGVPLPAVVISVGAAVIIGTVSRNPIVFVSMLPLLALVLFGLHLAYARDDQILRIVQQWCAMNLSQTNVTARFWGAGVWSSTPYEPRPHGRARTRSQR